MLALSMLLLGGVTADLPVPTGGDDHAWMTHATLRVLPASDLVWLGPELAPLMATYCHLPDLNWNNYGTFGGWSGLPTEPRTPDLRREWAIGDQTGWNPETRVGRRFNHAPPDAWQALPFYVPNILDCLQSRDYLGALLKMGCMAHLIQDSGTYPSVQAIHRARGFDVTKIAIDGYQPQSLGADAGSIVPRAVERVKEMVSTCDEQLPAIREALRVEDHEAYTKLRVAACNEAAKVVADLWHTLIALHGDCAVPPPAKLGQNLALNPGFEESDGEERQPRHWFTHWCDLNDRLGRTLWEGRIQRNGRLWHGGRASVSILWAPAAGLEWCQAWPACTYVTPGELYVASAWLKVHAATGQSGLLVRFYDATLKVVGEVSSPSLEGTADWRQVRVAAEVPAGAVKLRLVLRSAANEGGAWFDDIELQRVDRGAFEAAQQAGLTGDDLVLDLTFGPDIRDRSSFGGLHTPIAQLSGTGQAALTLSEDNQRLLRLDGVDDFVEVPRSHVEDVLSPTQALTVVARVRLREARPAVIAEKLDPSGGWQFGVSAAGKAELLVRGSAGDTVAVGPTVPVDAWSVVVGQMAVDGTLRVLVDGEPGEAAQRQGKAAESEASLVVGSDHGVRAFLAGDLSLFRVYRVIVGFEDAIR